MPTSRLRQPRRTTAACFSGDPLCLSLALTLFVPIRRVVVSMPSRCNSRSPLLRIEKMEGRVGKRAWLLGDRKGMRAVLTTRGVETRAGDSEARSRDGGGVGGVARGRDNGGHGMLGGCGRGRCTKEKRHAKMRDSTPWRTAITEANQPSAKTERWSGAHLRNPLLSLRARTSLQSRDPFAKDKQRTRRENAQSC